MTTKTEALKLALEALERCGSESYTLERDAITAIKEALAQDALQALHDEDKSLGLYEPEQEPDELRHIGEQDCLLDVDEEAWRSIVENRGGCCCHLSPPCGACSNPISEEEMNEVGYTYTSPQPAQRTWVGLTDEEINKVLGGDIHDEPNGLLEFVRAIEAKLKEKNI